MILRGFVVISHSKHNELQETWRGEGEGLMMMMAVITRDDQETPDFGLDDGGQLHGAAEAEHGE